ncbi:MAG: acyl-CoA thioesterase [Moorea sp. SIOASIH]|uniref:acyl-CoA thioesterase n=1 Tax=Moorena sp. SIOASIH TaxID=2607817 RepID=UPI0013BA63BE|nr:thioesterase family protein [Moorena sp. SIOASIH]NEO40109.1 acyl-CoA thioesterase [Moorena sp. SIOASIH]
MSETPQTSAQEQLDNTMASHELIASKKKWFDYPVRVHPHHTDYAGIVWHGTYLRWMEEARVEYLRLMGMDYSDLVRLGCDLPVVELSLRYHRAMPMGTEAVVKTAIAEMKDVRMKWNYRIQSHDGTELYLTGRVTLVPVDREQGKIMRKLPPALKDVLEKFSS